MQVKIFMKGLNHFMADYQPGSPVPAQQQQQRTSITTSLLSMWDANNNGVQLRMQALDSGLSVQFWIPFIGPDGRRTYPREQRVSTILTQKNCMAMEKAILNVLLPEYDAGKNTKVGVFTNNARSTFFELECRDGEFYANLHQGCDATTHVPQNMLTFKFEAVLVGGNFNTTTGESEMIPIQADFYLFSKVIQGYNYLASGYVSGHGVRAADHSFHVQLMDHLRSIANAVHAQLPPPSYQRTGMTYNPAGAAAPAAVGQDMAQGGYPTPTMTEVNDLSDLY